MEVPRTLRFSDREPLLRGRWGNVAWELFFTRRAPRQELMTTVGCVAIVSLHPFSTVLTFNDSSHFKRQSSRANKFEIPGGHRDPINPKEPNGPRETPLQAVSRESLEECGFVVDPKKFGSFAYRKIKNPRGGPGKKYAAVNYQGFWWAQTSHELQPSSNPDSKDPHLHRPPYAVVNANSLTPFENAGALNPMEAQLIRLGGVAAYHAAGMSLSEAASHLWV